MYVASMFDVVPKMHLMLCKHKQESFQSSNESRNLSSCDADFFSKQTNFPWKLILKLPLALC